jgi:hypothetical protein
VSLTVNQLDPNGNLIATTQSQPLDPGGHLAVYVSDFFPGTTGVQGALSVTATGSVGASVAVLGLRQNGTPVSMASMPVTVLPLTGTGINITSTLDTKSQAGAAIPPAGGTLSLTDAKGNKFTLTIPANALLTTTTVTMTALTAINGLPAGASFNSGVQLEPDGLVLFEPALLTIEPISPVSPDMIIPLGWHGTGQGVYLNAVQPQAEKLTFLLPHFSGVSLAMGEIDDWVTEAVRNMANFADVDASEFAFWTTKARVDIMAGSDSSAHFALAMQALANNYKDWVEPLMNLALKTNDDDLLLCARTHAYNYQRQRELLRGDSARNDAIGNAIYSFYQQATDTLRKHTIDRCTKNHDPLAGWELWAYAREQQLTDSNADDSATIAVITQCPFNPLLNFSSDLSGNVQVPTGDGIFDGKVSAKFYLAASKPSSLTPGQDGYLHYPVSGSGPLNYDSATFSLMGTACSPFVSGTKGSTLQVLPQSHGINSEIKYQFTPKFNPRAVRTNGQLLCQFCPMFTTTPVSVTLIVNPGLPAETITLPPCGGGVMPTSNFWFAFWDIAHFSAKTPDMGVFVNWQIPGPGMNSFAHKDIQQAVTGSSSGGTTTVIEITKLDLNQPQQ